MDPERIKNITLPIEADNIGERRELLDEKIDLISLIYADKKYQEIKKEKPDYKFHEALKDHTLIVGRIKRRVSGLEGFSFKQHKEKMDLFFESFFEKLDSLYEDEGLDADKILGLISLAKDSIREYLGIASDKQQESKKGDENMKKNNLVYFEDVPSITGGESGRWSALLKLGFSKCSKLTEVHVRDFYKTGLVSPGLELIRKDLEKVALHIVDESPETAVVIGASWLLSTPIAKALGFRILPEDNKRNKENDPSLLDLPQSFIDNPNTQKLLRLFKEEDRSVFVNFLRNMFAKNIPMKDFEQNQTEEVRRIVDDFRGMNYRYTEKKVFID